jgi:glycosyltransferase involved in cell wall biosynthesis
MSMESRQFTIFIPHLSHNLTDHEPHGDGLVADHIIRHLAERGHRLHVACHRVSVRQPYPKNVTLHPWRTRKPPAATGRLEYVWRTKLALREVRRGNRIDVVHQLNPVTAGLSLGLIGSGLPVVLGPLVPVWPIGGARGGYAAARALVDRLVRRPLSRTLLYLEGHAAAALVTSTPAAGERFCRAATFADRTHVVPFGIDPDRFTPEAPVVDRGPAAVPESILFLANLEAHKGVFTLLEAFEQVVRVLPGSRLLIAGSGPAEGEVRARIARMSAGVRVTCLGRIPRDQVAAVIRRSTVYCLPSYGEPFGMSALEAMACGRPLVVSDAGGLSHLIDDSGGRKFPVGDSAAMAKALIEILSSPALQHAMGTHNRRRVEQSFTWEQVVSRLESVYQAVVSPGGRALAVAESAMLGAG